MNPSSVLVKKRVFLHAVFIAVFNILLCHDCFTVSEVLVLFAVIGINFDVLKDVVEILFTMVDVSKQFVIETEDSSARCLRILYALRLLHLLD